MRPVIVALLLLLSGCSEFVINVPPVASGGYSSITINADRTVTTTNPVSGNTVPVAP